MLANQGNAPAMSTSAPAMDEAELDGSSESISNVGMEAPTTQMTSAMEQAMEEQKAFEKWVAKGYDALEREEERAWFPNGTGEVDSDSSDDESESLRRNRRADRYACRSRVHLVSHPCQLLSRTSKSEHISEAAVRASVAPVSTPVSR